MSLKQNNNIKIRDIKASIYLMTYLANDISFLVAPMLHAFPMRILQFKTDGINNIKASNANFDI